MIIKIISEIFGSLFCYEVFEIRRVCVCVSFCVPFLKNWDTVTLHTHKTSRESTCPIFSPSQGWKGMKKMWYLGRLNFSMTERVAPNRHLCSVLQRILDESWMWPQEDRVLAHCSEEASDSRGQPWMPHTDTQTSNHVKHICSSVLRWMERTPHIKGFG